MCSSCALRGRILTGVFCGLAGPDGAGRVAGEIVVCDCFLEVGHVGSEDGLVGGFVGVGCFCLLDGI